MPITASTWPSPVRSPVADVVYTPGGSGIADPSAWSFQLGDKLNIQWTNPDSANMTWGLEIGLAIAA